jgi:hypothetical protein
MNWEFLNITYLILISPSLKKRCGTPLNRCLLIRHLGQTDSQADFINVVSPL